METHGEEPELYGKIGLGENVPSVMLSAGPAVPRSDKASLGAAAAAQPGRGRRF